MLPMKKVYSVGISVTFLATEGWWVNGQTIFANGGYTTRRSASNSETCLS